MRPRHSGVAMAATVLALVIGTTGVANASHSWNNYHWARTSNPFTLALGDNVSSDWDGYLTTSASQWSASSVLDANRVAGATTGKRCKATRGRVEVCSAAYGRNGWLGLASISVTGGTHITQGTVKVNDTYFKIAQYNNPNERAHTMCQEIGHTFGLDHTSEDGSSQQTCMDYSSDPASTDPNTHDYQELGTIYAHLDATSTVGAASRAAAPQVGNDRASWGRKIDSHGNHATYLRNFGHGKLVLTDVTWAD